MKSRTIVLIASTSNFSPANYLIESFREIGYKVFVISDVRGPHTDLAARGGVNLKKILREYEISPELILFIEGGKMGVFPIYFDQLSCPKFWWGIDTHNDYQKHLRISRLFDHTFVAQKSYVDLLSSDGIASVSWLPLAYPSRGIGTNKKVIDVSYVGSRNWSLYPERGELLEALNAEFSNILIDSRPPKEMLEIYRNSKVVFNHSLKNDINMRYFEAMGSGALLCTNEILSNGLEDLFIVGEDLIVYRDKLDLVMLVRGMLAQPDRLEEIANNGMKKVRNFHTYDHRAAEIVAKSNQAFPRSAPDSFAFSGALLSMGFISDAFSHFFKAARRESRGVKNRFILSLLRPLIQLIILVARLVENLAKQVRSIL